MHRFKNILFVAETGESNSAALERAVALSNTNQAALTVMDVVTLVPEDRWVKITPLTPGEIIESVVAEQRERLESLVSEIAGGREVRIEIARGRAFLEIIQAVLRENFDLVIKPVTQKPASGGLLGSIDMHLLRKCPCPVWIEKQRDAGPYRNILAAVDMDPENPESGGLNQQILEMSTSLALADSAELHVVHAWSFAREGYLRSPRLGLTEGEIEAIISHERQTREDWLQRLMDEIGGRGSSDAVDYLQPCQHIERGEPRELIPAKARDLSADLIVMGTVGRTGIPGFFMGNTAEDILGRIDCSVLAVKPPGFVSPVSTK